MEWTSIVVAAVSGLAMVFAAGLGLQVKRNTERTDRRAQRRAEESLLAMSMQSACLKLALVTAKTVQKQKTNGDVEEAMQSAAQAQEDYERFIRQTAAEQVSKI